ncbi:hypothetical protein IMCC14465_13050 [alpha proteobacterium IMCC14465]|uniref:Uncharacterized protein n=1 Tax=alpha proteobacterium IMCC14465 TaxID=1220535 RepID=J9E0T2_9PROT|nr:hypothetical protein IMCC14465_13050 [alpha proteobacterium IMCC14465]
MPRSFAWWHLFLKPRAGLALILQSFGRLFYITRSGHNHVQYQYV